MTHWHESLSDRGASFDGAVVSGFGNSAAELAAARDAAVLCDLAPVAALRITGPDAEAFLQGQFTNDVSALAPGATQYSAWCSPKGRVLANFLLRRIDATTFELLLPALLLAPIRKRLSMFVLRAKVALDDASAASVRIGIAGPAARQAVESLGAGAPPLFGSVALAGGALFQVPGGRFVVTVAPESAASCWDRLAAHARPAGFECWRWLTIRAGVPVIIPATQDQFIPQAINLDALAGVSFQKGCYTGQEIVARTQYLGRLKERTVLAHTVATTVAPGMRLFSSSFSDQPCGSLLNAASAPTGGTDFLAVCQVAASASGDLRLGAADGVPLSLLPLHYELPGSSGAARVHRSTLNRP
ncbi:MAG TPA: folate-binding protein [Casimicrobiaceae bacterium]|nr:folate-binding protein [Casimicrobiaceae bacterium]